MAQARGLGGMGEEENEHAHAHIHAHLHTLVSVEMHQFSPLAGRASDWRCFVRRIP